MKKIEFFSQKVIFHYFVILNVAFLYKRIEKKNNKKHKQFQIEILDMYI